MKEYKNENIVVYWMPELCAHPGTCVRALPEVFNPGKRPWIDIEAASPEEIIKAIDLCPTGALRYSIPEGSGVDASLELGSGLLTQQSDPNAVKIKVIPNGPLLLEGSAIVIGADGTTLNEGSKMVLCGCGRTCHKPFCDASHSKQETN